jgi:hypothetical protein
MTALMAFNPAIQAWVPIDVKTHLGYLVLQAQRLEAVDIQCYFQIGVMYEAQYTDGQGDFDLGAD